MSSLDGRSVIVTGSATGIGRGIASEVAAAGADVVLVDVDERVSEVAAGLGGTAVVGDVSDPATVDSAIAAAGPTLDLAQLVVDQGLRAQQPEERLVDGQVHDLPGRGVDVAVPQREHRRERTEHRGHAVAESEGRQRGRAVGMAVDVSEPAHRFGDRAEAGAWTKRARLPVARAAHDDQSRVDRVQHVRTQPPTLERAWPEGLDEHVSVPDQLLDDLGAR